MFETIFTDIKVAGLAAATPVSVCNLDEFIPMVGGKAVKRIKKATGIEQFRKSIKKQTASDLDVIAAERILVDKGIDRTQIGAVINITQTPDYKTPATAFVIHKRLNLPEHCIAFDVNLGCTGYVYGLFLAASILHSSSFKYVLLTVGDVPKRYDLQRRKHPDHTYLMMFGDAGTATLLEKTNSANKIITSLRADGNDFSMIHTIGGTRCLDVPHDIRIGEEGKEWSYYDSYMDGMGVFSFSTKVAPEILYEFMRDNNIKMSEVDGFYLHQANKTIIDIIARLSNLPSDKVHLSLDRYGNTSCGSIPVTIVDSLGNCNSNTDQHIMLCGFGIGLSWGVALVDVSPKDIYPMIYSDDYYQDGDLGLPNE